MGAFINQFILTESQKNSDSDNHKITEGKFESLLFSLWKYFPQIYSNIFSQVAQFILYRKVLLLALMAAQHKDFTCSILFRIYSTCNDKADTFTFLWYSSTFIGRKWLKIRSTCKIRYFKTFTYIVSIWVTHLRYLFHHGGTQVWYLRIFLALSTTPVLLYWPFLGYLFLIQDNI